MTIRLIDKQSKSDINSINIEISQQTIGLSWTR